jgi:hypothetical protein
MPGDLGGYDIMASTDSVNYIVIGTNQPGDTAFIHTDILPDKLYSYQIRAFNKDRTKTSSSCKKTLQSRTYPKPQSIKIKSVSVENNDFIRVVWDIEPLVPILDFEVERSENTIIVETGGMKDRKREMVRDELHKRLKSGFGVDVIHSEYGMTELFSQAWSDGNGKFITPPWMKVLIRDINDPLSLLKDGTTGGINIIDLANVHSCAFIATQDLGRKLHDGSFEVLGRFDNSDIRGCNLLMA